MPRVQQGPFLVPRKGKLCWKGDGGARDEGSLTALQGQRSGVIIRAVILISRGECCGKKQHKKPWIALSISQKNCQDSPAHAALHSPPAWPHPALPPDEYAMSSQDAVWGAQAGGSDGGKILLSLLSCRDRGQASYVWAASWAASFLKTPQSFWLHDHIAALKPSQFMGIFMQLAPVQGFFSFTFISHLTWPLA